MTDRDRAVAGERYRIKSAETEVSELRSRLSSKDRELSTIQADLTAEIRRRSNLWDQLQNPTTTAPADTQRLSSDLPSVELQATTNKTESPNHERIEPDFKEYERLRMKEIALLEALRSDEEVLHQKDDEILALKFEIGRLRDLLAFQNEARRRSIRHSLSSSSSLSLDASSREAGETIEEIVLPPGDHLQPALENPISNTEAFEPVSNPIVDGSKAIGEQAQDVPLSVVETQEPGVGKEEKDADGYQVAEGVVPDQTLSSINSTLVEPLIETPHAEALSIPPGTSHQDEQTFPGSSQQVSYHTTYHTFLRNVPSTCVFLSQVEDTSIVDELQGQVNELNQMMQCLQEQLVQKDLELE